jgi:hypothetical protein
VQKLSEKTQSISEENPKSFRKTLTLSERTNDHILTVRETAKIFEDSAVPRTERSITNWCNENSQRERRLDCYYDNSEHKYYITPQSVHKVIKEEKMKLRNDSEYLNSLSENRQEFSEAFGKNMDSLPNGSEKATVASESNANTSEQSKNNGNVNIAKAKPREDIEEKNKRLAEMEEEINKLREEKIRAESSTGYKDELLTFFKNQIAHDREDYNERMKFMQEQIIKIQEQSNKYVDQTIDSQRRIGSLEAQLRQLEAPKFDRRNEDVRSDEIRYRDASSEYQPPQAQNFSEPPAPEVPGSPPESNVREQGEELLDNQNRNHEDNNERFSIRTDSGEQNGFSGEADFPRQS